MPNLRRTLVAAACTLFLAAATATAGEEGLLGLTGLIPEDPLTYQSIPLFSYVDFRAVEQAAGVPTPADEKSFAASPKADLETWMRGVFRIKVGPPSILRYAGRVGVHAKTSYDAVGPDWFAVDRAMALWQAPPHGVTLVAGDEDLTDPEGFNFALPPRGFVRDEVDGIPFWHRFADDAIASELNDEAIEGDIFDTGMMTGLRIAVLPGMLAAAGNWPDLRAVLAVQTGKARPAAAAELLRPMIEAFDKIEGAGGPAIQAVAFTLPDVGLTPSAVDGLLGAMAGGVDPAAIAKEIEGTMETGQNGPPLPPYPLALFADFADGGDQLLVIALPYADRPTAEAATVVLADRLNAWQPGRSRSDAPCRNRRPR